MSNVVARLPEVMLPIIVAIIHPIQLAPLHTALFNVTSADSAEVAFYGGHLLGHPFYHIRSNAAFFISENFS